tara:strand:- start:1853 stop:2680 length:828 start_codon:yes stop_codon:yes gene_type:complete
LRYKTAVGLLLFTGIIWSTGGFMIKLIPWSPFIIAGIRSAIAALIIYFYSRPQKISINKYTIGGALAYLSMVIFFVLANKLTTAGNAILIQYSAPVYVALFSIYFLGEKVTSIDWLSILIIIFGLFLFFLDDLTGDSVKGNIAAMFSSFGFAGLILFLRKQKHGSPIDTILLGNLLTFLVCMPFIFKDITFEANAWFKIIYLGIVQLGFAYILFTIAIKHVTALDGVIYPVIEPIFSPIFAYLILGEKLGSFGYVGGFLVLGGVLFRGLLKIKKP